MAGPVIEVMFDVAEIERVIEEDVMLVAADLGLNVTVEEFVRFGTFLYVCTHIVHNMYMAMLKDR